MDDLNLRIEYVPIGSIKAYSRNAKLHPQEQIEQIKESIRQVGFRDPIGIWHGEIVEGHGRHIAAKELGMETVPVIKLDDMTDEERRAYMLIHNQTTMNSGWDMDLLDIELAEITDIDMTAFGFDQPGGLEDADESENPYTDKVNIPQYEPQGLEVGLGELTDLRKYRQLVNRIDNSNIATDEKEFLKLAAARHIVFDYRKIAEYYAKADEQMQEMMEDSALVIIDVNDAIAKGYAVLRNSIEEIAFEGIDND